MLTRIRHLLEMIRFSHTIFALPFALLAGLMALYASRTAFEGTISVHDTYLQVGTFRLGLPSGVVPESWHDSSTTLLPFVSVLAGIVLCMIFARSAAMSFNRIVDWKIDRLNPRTDKRHIPVKLLSVGQVAFFFVICCVGFVASTLIFVPNWLPFYLSIPVLLFICGYSYTKRFTALAHFWLGSALMLRADLRVDCSAWRGSDAKSGRPFAVGDPGRSRHALGGWLRHHLCLPGCGI